jgi:hypothetical protein
MTNGRHLNEVEIQLAIAELEARMVTVEEGVSNFREFKEMAKAYFIEDRITKLEQEKVNKRRAKIHFALLGAALTLLTGILLILAQLWAGGHKIVTNDQHAISEGMHQQDARNPQLVERTR